MNIAPGPLKFVEIIPEDGVTCPLWGGPIRFISLAGAGVAPLTRIQDKNPIHHGRTDRGYRLNERRMLLTLYVDGIDPQQSDSIRDKIAYLFGPTYEPLKLRVTREDNEVRQILCFVDGEVDFPMSERVGTAHRVLVPLVAPDPTWYDPTEMIINTALSNGSNNITITVAGTTFGSNPILRFTGQLTSGTVLSSELTADTITLSLATLASVTNRTIDLTNSFKTVNTVTGVNAFSDFTFSSLNAFTSFRIPSEKEVRDILADPTATDFTLNVNASGVDGFSDFTIRWFKRYISL